MVDRLCGGGVEAHGFGPDALDADGMRDLADACRRSGVAPVHQTTAQQRSAARSDVCRAAVNPLVDSWRTACLLD